MSRWLPGETYTYTQPRIFVNEGPYFFQIVYETVPTEWQFIGSRVDMTVASPACACRSR